jgi:hypothetical protein
MFLTEKIDTMNDFWAIIQGWPPFGQGLFLLIVIGGIIQGVVRAVFYGTVMFQGWPPEHVVNMLENDDDEEEI